MRPRHLVHIHVIAHSLDVFVEDIKYMQQTVQQEMNELESSENEFRKLFNDNDDSQMIHAERLRFLLEEVKKLKVTHIGSIFNARLIVQCRK